MKKGARLLNAASSFILEGEMPTPRPHYKERIAHAEGYEIEVYIGMGVWETISCPSWNPNDQYRVKPEPKPDVMVETGVDLGGIHGPYLYHEEQPNLRLTFDGETGQLKSAEVIQQS